MLSIGSVRSPLLDDERDDEVFLVVEVEGEVAAEGELGVEGRSRCRFG
jgi:hypothetical protein